MRRFLTMILLPALAACTTPGMEYPETRTVDHVDTLHGVEVPDPYRWLEEVDSDETRDWIRRQNEVTFAYLRELPQREQLQQRLTELWNYPRYSVPTRVGARYFYSRNDGLQNQSVVYVTDSLDEAGQLLLDPNTMSEDGTIALTGFEVSPSGTMAAYGVSSGGSDWQEWRIRQVSDGVDADDHIRWVKFSSVSWNRDSSGFYYSRYDAPAEGEALEDVNRFHKLYFHRVGTPQEEDTLVYERSDQPDWGFRGNVTDDGRYLIIDVWKGTDTKNGIFYRDLGSPGAEVVELLTLFDASYEFVGNNGSRLWFLTDLDAPRGRLIELDLRRPGRDNWTTPIAERDDTLTGVHVVGGQFIAAYLADAHSEIRRFEMDGAEAGPIELPGLGAVSGFSGKADHDETFFGFESFTTPATVYRYDFASGEVSRPWSAQLNFDPSDFVTEQVFVTSADGTRLPMFVSYKEGLERNGDNPALLYGYGGFNISTTPRFRVPNLVWMEQGGVFASANLRGGGEYGESWHQAGMKLKKQNVFDDFIAAAGWLIDNGYTSSSRLAIEGGSNGGLLVGAAMIQRPDLFAVAIPRVGVMDMLRFHKFTIGWAWVSDYGSPDNPEEFAALHAYSPYHNLEAGSEYPATLVMTADHDDRVVPAHSFKFAAALQQAQAGAAPVLIRVETRAGHGAGKPVSKSIEEEADKLAFILANIEQ